MTRICAVSILLFTAACGGDTGGSGKAAAGTKDGKAASGAVSGGAVAAPATFDSLESCLKSCEGTNDSATDRATCRLNCDAVFSSERKNDAADSAPK